jgi:hypothetical protein
LLSPCRFCAKRKENLGPMSSGPSDQMSPAGRALNLRQSIMERNLGRV